MQIDGQERQKDRQTESLVKDICSKKGEIAPPKKTVAFGVASI